MFPHKDVFIDYQPVVNNLKNVVGIGTSILKVAGRGNVNLSDKYGRPSWLEKENDISMYIVAVAKFQPKNSISELKS